MLLLALAVTLDALGGAFLELGCQLRSQGFSPLRPPDARVARIDASVRISPANRTNGKLFPCLNPWRHLRLMPQKDLQLPEFLVTTLFFALIISFLDFRTQHIIAFQGTTHNQPHTVPDTGFGAIGLYHDILATLP